MVESLVRARTLQGFGELVANLGGDARDILQRAGLDPAVLERSDEWISFRSVLVAYESAAIATNCRNFGIQLSERRDLSYLGPLVLIFKYSRDLEHGLSSCVKYISVHNTGYLPVLDVRGRTASWQFRMDDKLRANANQWIEETMLTAIKFVRIFLGEKYVPKAVHCRHAAIDGTDYASTFGTDILFREPFDGLVLDRKDLRSPNPINDQEVYQFLLGYLDSRVLRAGKDLPGAVRSLLRKLIPTGKFSVDVVADQLGMHRRTLQRRLQSAGVSYADLLDDSRAEMAREFLSTSNLPMVNLAYMLGYADQSAFNHAFRRWYGMTPRRWCERHLD